LCNGPVPGHLPECNLCGSLAPRGKIPASAVLLKKDQTTGRLVLTAAGHAAARQGEEEGRSVTHHQGRAAKGKGIEKRQAKEAPSKVQALTLKKDILILKIWGTKTGELWMANKASRVTAGGTTVHSAGRFVGHFNVLQTKSAWSVREALEWLGHTNFVPHSPSLDASVLFYYKLFTDCPADMDQALAWDHANALEKRDIFYAWEDTHTHHYIVHEDGKHPWTFPQEQPRLKPKTKKAIPVKPKSKAKKALTYRGYEISTKPTNIKLVDDHTHDLTVLGTVLRKPNKKYQFKALKLVSGVTAIRVPPPLACVVLHVNVVLVWIKFVG
jgi:hypothetical protein